MLRVQLVVLLVVTPAFGAWCWLVLVTEYVTNYYGDERSVGIYAILLALAVWGALCFATVTTWRSLRPRPKPWPARSDRDE
jgi:hypothetical protein